MLKEFILQHLDCPMIWFRVYILLIHKVYGGLKFALRSYNAYYVLYKNIIIYFFITYCVIIDACLISIQMNSNK